MAQVNLDSLWNVWNNETEADTNRLNAMHDIIWKGYLHSQPDSALYFAQIQFDFSEEIEDQNWMANALNAQGVSIWFKGDLIKAIEKLNHAKTIYIKTGHKKGLSNVYNNLGSVYKNQGDYVNAILYYQKTMIIQEERNDQNGISLTLNNIGVIHFNQKDYDKTIENCEKSLAIAVEMKKSRSSGKCFK